MSTRRSLSTTAIAVLATISPVAGANPAAASRVASERASAAGLEIEIRRPFASADLVIRRIGGPIVHRGTSTSTPLTLFPRLGDDDAPLEDGVYVYELRVHPDAEDRSAPVAADGDGPPAPVLVVDVFEVREGRLFREPEEAATEVEADALAPRTTAGPDVRHIARRDVLSADDFIVEGSICASDGDECVDEEESFLTPVLVNAQAKLKDADPTVWLNDTTSGHDDWVLRTQSGNLRIQNAETGNDAIFVEEGAKDAALYINGSGEVGLGTANPSDRLHLVHTDPTIRFTETDGGGASFRLRVDTQSESRRFVIQEGAKAAPLLTIDQDTGAIGLGNAALAAADLSLTSAGGSWSLASRDGSMTIARQGSGGEELEIRDRLDAHGPTLVVQGSVRGTQCVNTSSREIKTAFAAVDPAAVLADLGDLPVTTWRYRHEPEGTRHIGPVAEDFRDLFGLGDGETISTVDAIGVLMAAVQALDAENRDLQERLEALEEPHPIAPAIERAPLEALPR